MYICRPNIYSRYLHIIVSIYPKILTLIRRFVLPSVLDTSANPKLHSLIQKHIFQPSKGASIHAFYFSIIYYHFTKLRHRSSIHTRINLFFLLYSKLIEFIKTFMDSRIYLSINDNGKSIHSF